MRIQFDYNWYDQSKTVIQYSARDNWTWKDYHSVVRASLYTVQSQPNTVHTLIDFSTGQRAKFPAGISAHAQTFGKKLTPNLSGNAIVIGASITALEQLGVAESRVLLTKDGEVRFIAGLDAVQQILVQWE